MRARKDLTQISDSKRDDAIDDAVHPLEATMIASSLLLGTVECACLGPVRRSLTDVRRFPLATVFGLLP